MGDGSDVKVKGFQSRMWAVKAAVSVLRACDSYACRYMYKNVAPMLSPVGYMRL